MILIFLSLAAIIAVAAVARWPRSPRSAAVSLAAGGVALAVGATSLRELGHAAATLAPAVGVLVAGLTLAAAAGRCGLAERAADGLVRAARGRRHALYGLVCGLTALLTAAVSL